MLSRLNRSDALVHLFVTRKGEAKGIDGTTWMEVTA
jgi:hypothetical protein